jgi:glycosyltransferase involved in cell wall biosynthesis
MNSSKTAKPSLVILLSRFPYPLEKGDKLRAYHQIVGLSNHFSITLICITDVQVSTQDENVLKKYCNDIHIFKLNKIIQLLNLSLCIFSEKPFQVAYFWQYHIHRKIQKIIYKKKPEFIYAQLIRTTEYIKNYHQCPKTIDYMDVFSMGIERRINTQPWYLKSLFKQEYQRLKNYERHIFDYFEEHLIISEQDRSFIIHPKSKEIKVLKNGISEHFFIDNQIDKKYDLVFTGNMSYPPNIAASNFIIKEILPKLNNSFSLLISGVNPPKSLLKYHSNKINISGWIEDIRESYLKSKIFVAPMFLGTGLQNKLLEAMALGVPCITTTMANTALGAVPEKSILIADNSEEFTNQINRLIQDEELYKTIKKEGQEFVKNNFSWELLNEQLHTLIVNSRNKY